MSKNESTKKEEVRLRVVFDRRKQATKVHAGAVEVEVTTPTVRRRLATGVRVFAHQWNGSRVVRHPEAAALNAAIEEKVEELREAALQGAIESGAVAGQRRGKAMTPIAWLRAEMEERQIAETTRKHHEGLMKELEASGLFLRWKDFTPRVLAMWDARLRRVRGLTHQATIYDYHKRLRAYLAKAELMGIIAENPYRRYKVAKGASTASIRYLTEAERDRIAALVLPEGEGIAIARDMFLLSCYTGLSYSDMIKVRRGDIEVQGDRVLLIDRRQKTDTPYRLTILPAALDILQRYGWNMDRLSNQKANAYLKGIAAAAGIAKRLTMHMGRHTFATWALTQGVPIEIVSKMLAHTRIETTQIYAKVLQPEVDRGFDLLAEALSTAR